MTAATSGLPKRSFVPAMRDPHTTASDCHVICGKWYHLSQFGGYEVPRNEYLGLLRTILRQAGLSMRGG
jgi:Leu/Phe-tRNA-protein transferase